MVQMLALTSDPNTLRSALPNFSQTTHIFLPINDNRNPNMPEAGSHWSLLVVSVADNASFHYDSLNSANEPQAGRISEKLGRLLGRQLVFKDLDNSPQQLNLSDCGIFVCLTLRHLLVNRLLKRQKGEKVSMSMAGRDVDAAKGRKEISNTIESLRREAERRRSS